MKVIRCVFLGGIAAGLLACADSGRDSAAVGDTRPNILLIVADDLGYTDLGSFGGEIPTPNLDGLARSGVRLTNFHTSVSCAPTRSMLLSGTDNHLAGMGTQGSLITPRQEGHPGYQNRLSKSVKSIAMRLGNVGYRTYMAGKWHLGTEPGYLPGARGFDRSFVLGEGGASHFDNLPLFPEYETADWYRDDRPVEVGEGFYSTAGLTDTLIEFIEADARQDSPFFAYLAYTAPHWPIQAPDDLLEKYRGSYAMGYDELRESRMTGAIRERVVPPEAVSVSQTPGLPPWNALSDERQAGYVARMGAYAAMVDGIDQNVGRLLAFLENRGDLANTVIVFMSDNGAEGHAMDELPRIQDWIDEHFDRSLESVGRANSYTAIGLGWARATAAPFRLHKARISEGGIRVPAFVHLADQEPGRLDDAYMTVMDLAPTFLELANTPSDHQITGKSLLARLRGADEPVHGRDDILAYEVFGRRAVQRGPWKLLWMEAPYGVDGWQLYNLSSDPGEQTDLAGELPELVADLSDAWETYAQDVGVILPEHPIPY